MGFFVYFPCSLPELWSWNRLKMYIFCNFIHTSALESIKAIYIHASERSRYALSENCIFYYAMTYFFGDIRVLSQKILLNFCWVSISFDISIATISKTLAQNPIDHIIFWKSVMMTFLYTYVNCFNRLRFLAKFSTKLQKKKILDNLRTTTQEENMETRQMTPFCSSTFSALAVCDIDICNSQNSFSCGPPLVRSGL